MRPGQVTALEAAVGWVTTAPVTMALVTMHATKKSGMRSCGHLRIQMGNVA